MKYFFVLSVVLIAALPMFVSAQTSTCYGTSSKGSIERAVKLPAKGSNFVAYSHIARIAGRTYVHSEVNEIVVAAFISLEAAQPDKVYKYAETGLKKGGEFKPHKTHRNGLSVDFMTPVLDRDGNSVHLPTSPLNKFGYSIEFDDKGWYKNLAIDYVALAAHIVELHKAAKKRGHDLWRVIFAPELQVKLFETIYGDYLRKNIKFSTRRSWVRHDEHYHVDFAIPCE